MNVSIDRTNLEYGLSVIMGAVEKKKIGDYAGSILMSSRAGSKDIELHASDMEIFASITLEGIEIERAGRIVLPAEKFSSSIKGAGAGNVNITSDDLKTFIEGTAASYEMAGLDPIDFPIGTKDDFDLAYTFPAARLAGCIHAVNHSINRDIQKINISGIRFIMEPLEDEGGRVTVLATNGHCLSLAALDIPGENIIDQTRRHAFTLPGKAAGILGGINGSVVVGRVTDQNRLAFLSGSTIVCATETASEYPDVRRILPTGPGEVITVDTEALISALESCCCMSEDQYRSVNLHIAAESIIVTALGKDSNARASIPCMCDADCTIKIRINSRYLLQALKSLDSDETFIKYFGEKSPLVLIPADHKHWSERVEVIMLLGGAA